MDDPTPDVPMLRKAVAWAKEQATLPESECEWYQADYLIPGDQIDRVCDSCFCIAGFVVHQYLSVPEMRELGPEGLDDLARQMLSITCDEAAALFDGNNQIERVVEFAEEIAHRAGEKL